MDEQWHEVVDVSNCFTQMVGDATRKFVELGGKSAEMSVLDIGCGVGDVTRAIADRLVREKGRVLGIDTCQAMVDFAKQRHAGATNLDFVAQSAVPANSADAAYCGFTLPFVADPQSLLASTMHSLKPGGRFCVMGIGDHAENDFMAGLGAEGGPALQKALKWGNEDVLRHELEKAGFRHVTVKRIRALATISDVAAYWKAVRGLLGIGFATVPPALAARLAPGQRLPLSLVFAMGIKEDTTVAKKDTVLSGKDTIALARKKAWEIGPLSVKQTFKREKIVYIDLRAPAERVTQIRDSHNIQRHHLEKQLPALVADPSALIVLYSQDGEQGALASEQLRRMGYINVWNLQDGMNAWEYVGMKVAPA